MGLTNYIKETKSELQQTKWPTRRQTINYTLLVVGLSLAAAVLLGFSDVVFGFFLKLLL